jgi:hypothetical protein
MKCGKEEDILIKDNIPRNINTARRNIQALVSLMKGTIAKKSTLLGSE